MRAQPPNLLASSLREFFVDHLPCLRGLSPHTIQSYRDSLVLLLRFLASHRQRPVSDLGMSDFQAPEILAFLSHLEEERRNTASTRNVRLAAIHAFFRYFAAQYPDQLEHAQRVLGVSFKRARQRAVEYLEEEEIQAVLSAIDRSTRDGQRDYALLATLFNTGARAQEIVDLRARDLQLTRPFQVRLFGKGRKERFCPLWPQTTQVLRAFSGQRQLDSRSDAHVFLNHRQQPLTRFGVRYILAKHVRRPRPRGGPAFVPVQNAVCCLRREMSGSALPNTFRLTM